MADIVCPTCSTQYRISDSQLTKASKLRCTKCGTEFRLQDNVATQTFSSQQAAPDLQISQEDTTDLSEQASDSQTPDFDLSKIELNYPEPTSPAADESTRTMAPGDLSLDVNLGDLSLDFDTPTDSSSSEGDFSLDIDSEKDTGDILDPLQNASEPARTDFSFSFTDSSENDASSEVPSLDFSFSAAPPEGEFEDDDEEREEEEGEEAEEEYETLFQEAPEGVDLGLALGDVDFGTTEEEPLESFSDEEASVDHETVSYVSPMEEDEEAFDQEIEEEEEFLNCCLDSLAMGLNHCEVCGRNLEGKDLQAAQRLQQKRREELKGELTEAEVQVGFSEEQFDTGTVEKSPTTEDFSDVERALDALADGTFHQEIKKKEAKKTLAKTAKMIAGGVLAAVIVIALASLTLLPSSHEKLESRYEKLMAQKETDAKNLVQLFFDAAIKNDNDIFQRLTIMRTMPGITYGKVISVGDEYEKTSLGIPAKTISTLEQEISSLNTAMEEKTELLSKYSSKNLSPKIIGDRIKQLENKVKALNNEFAGKDGELSKKLRRLQQDLEEIEQDISKNRQTSRKYIDATDQVGKALYENSVIKQQALMEQKNKLLLQIGQEETKYQKLRQKLEAEYQPQFTTLEERLQAEKALREEANLLQDNQRSPVVVLSKELEQMTQTIIEKKKELEETRNQLNQALVFFKPQEKSQISQKQQDTEFVYTSKNVAASIKVGGSSAQQVSIVLKHYQAIFPENAFESNWLVEKIAK